jgi:hypothetical protein
MPGSFSDRVLQQARYQSSTTIDLSSDARLHLSASDLLLLIAISKSARSEAGVPRDKTVSSVTCHVTWRSWNSRGSSVSQKNV